MGLSSELNVDDALVYALYELESEKRNPTFTDLVVKSFKRFPTTFQLVGYPEYPDSSRVDKSWRRCRTDKKWIEGNQNTTFYLTEAGKIVAQNIGKRIGGKKISREKTVDKRSREGKQLSKLRSQDVFRKFLETNELPPNKFILKESLGMTPDTKDSVILNVINELLSSAETYSDRESKSFLIKARTVFSE
ncbi:Uncharacterised protein [uncultured archaeon]|nr:Uncharacterised protein [uncultured archaeon]